ncbi:MAG TPA: hypothetical protein VMU53_20360 [Candidatus Sulfotelmatobacter sp.]|nr:hypothetical protein [Candidatus Sulfotelmatobacter sp.]
MKSIFAIAAVSTLGVAILGTVGVSRAAAQDPILTPIIVSEAAPIIVKAVTPKPKPAGVVKFQGYIVNANTAQITARAKSNELSLQTFTLNPQVAAKMQKIVDNGGYQYGDKVTIYYDAATRTAVSIKGKPSRPL